ncbi:MAG: NUDIX domain-containing protein [Balneolaceae bacterium]|nr:NUDIX domain-containing protein [Balneolaceae bacterium]
MKQLIAGGGVLYRETDSEPLVLLIYRNDTWDLPKGKLEDGEDVRECAVREVSEELGISEPIIRSSLGTTYHEYEMDGTGYGKTTYWYSMIESRKPQEMKPQREEGISRLEWTPISIAIDRVGFDNLKTVLRQFSGEAE